MSVEHPHFEDVVNRFYEPLYRFAMSLSRQETQAWDLTQQTFLLWGTKGRQLRDKSKVKTWLFTTLHREFLGARRRENRFPHHDISVVERELPAVAPKIVNELDAQTVMDSLGEIEEIFRAPLTLFYLRDFSYQEIAETLDVPTGTVMSRLSRAKEQLRNLLSIKVERKRRERKSNDGDTILDLPAGRARSFP